MKVKKGKAKTTEELRDAILAESTARGNPGILNDPQVASWIEATGRINERNIKRAKALKEDYWKKKQDEGLEREAKVSFTL